MCDYTVSVIFVGSDYRVGLNLNYEFESAHEFFMNLNFVFSKSMNFDLILFFQNQ